VTTEDGYEGNDELRDAIITGVEDAIGPIARPEQVVFTPDLPNPIRKIMRRLFENIADGEELGNTSTLRNPRRSSKRSSRRPRASSRTAAPFFEVPDETKRAAPRINITIKSYKYTTIYTHHNT